MDDQTFLQAARELGYQLDAGATDRLERFRTLLEAGGKTASLTRIEGREAFYSRHVLDALTVVVALSGEPPPATIVDVGSGGGVPAIPLTIALGAHELYRSAGVTAPVVVALEAQGKKARFLAETATALGLGDRLRVDHRRAEEAGRDPAVRDTLDLAIARAVAALPLLLELALPLVRPGGLFVAYKGPRADAEVADAEHALAELGGEVEAVLRAPLPGRELRLVKIRKLSATPDRYPRRPGIPAKRPL